MKRVLLTGGNGFIGRYCVDELLARGYEVHATTSGAPPAHDHVQWHRVDLLNQEQSSALLAKVRPAQLLHLAWYAKHGLFWQARENLDWVRASKVLLQQFIALGGHRAVFAGSCAEYDWADGPCIESATPLRPQNLYGESKNALRLFAEEAVRNAGISCAWGRIFFLYGPREQPTRLVPLIVRALLRGEPVTCWNAELQRDYLYVADVAAALTELLDSPLQGAVNIGSGTAISVRGMVDRIVASLGHLELVSFAHGEAARQDAPLVVADTTRLSTELHWAPQVTIDHGLTETIDWCRQHLDANR